MVVAFVLGVAAAACGQKGPPQAPLRLLPAAPADLAVRRVDDRVHLRLTLPNRNVEGDGPAALDRVEVFATSLAPGAPVPADRELLAAEHLVGTVSVRPPLAEGEEREPGDTRPLPGEVVTIEEVLTPAALTPPPAPARPADAKEGAREGPTAPPATGQDAAAIAAAAGKEPASTDPVRVYIARGLTRGGRPGPASPRVQLPLVPVPPPPVDVTPAVVEGAVRLDWTVPAAPPGVAFNVYAADRPAEPINPAVLPEPGLEHTTVTFGEEQCYRVRSVLTAGGVPIEGPASAPVCVTPRDVFPPAAPRGLVAVSTPGQISLIWDANAERDLAGYLVLRGDAPDGPLRPLTPDPIQEATYRDTAVTPGMRYIYAVVAVDAAEPPNTSAQSPRVEETAR
jgi:hypothetical protein